MTKHLSQFGSLDDRSGHSRPAESTASGATVRHAWLDGDVAVLLLRWRKVDTRWEGQICGIAAHGPAMAWVSADRLRKADTSRSLT